MHVALLIVSLFLPQQECADVASCRHAALDAASSGDYERFHDLAWRAAQKGRSNDPELMALVARAQSLSGRPGDALVMLRRLAQMGVATEAATSDDFRRVRALPGWPELEAMIRGGITPEPRSAGTAAATPAPAEAKVTKNESAPAPARAAVEADALPDDFAAIQPAGLAYDGVSKRFIVGDRHDNKLIVYDDVFKRATNMVGADSAGFFGLTAVEIDPRRGDLWVANSSAGRGALHKLQLVSGRVLFELEVPTELGPTAFVDASVLPDGQVLLLDAEGRRLLSVSPTRRAFVRAAGVDVDAPTSVASIDGKVAYIAHQQGILRVELASRRATSVRSAPAGLLRIRSDRGALIGVQSTADSQRIVRLGLDSQGKRITRVEVVDPSVTMPDASGMTVDEGVVAYIGSVNGIGMIRRVKLRR